MEAVLISALVLIALGSVGTTCFMSITAQKQKSWYMEWWFFGLLVMVVTVMSIVGVVLHNLET